MKHIGLNGDIPQGEQQTQGSAACPEGNSMPPREISIPRGSSKARKKQHIQGEQHKKGSTVYIVPFYEIKDKLDSA